MPEYLKLPVKFDGFFDRQRIATCSLKESIIRNLHLLITTGTGENKQQNSYGCEFWDQEYDVHLSNDARREMVMNSLKRQIQLYEKRLGNVAVEVNIRQSEHKINNAPQIRRRIEMIITGTVKRTNEAFRFQTAFFIGPLLLD